LEAERKRLEDLAAKEAALAALQKQEKEPKDKKKVSAGAAKPAAKPHKK
jgi:hypothetical protein